VLSQSFAHFTIPEKEEGFDDIRYEWQKEAASKDYLRKWVLDRKLTSRIEDLQPGQWFVDKLVEWTKTYSEWQAKQKEYKNSAAKKAKDEKKEEEKKEEGAGDNDEEKGDDLDIFSVEDVCDVGSGEPLFANFTFEDWALLQLRFEMYFLQLAFRKDVDDEERVGIHETHLAFYYNKYYRKQLTPKHFGMSTNHEICKLVKDTVSISETTNVLVSALAEDTESVDIFVKLTEENRRERQRRIDAGDETAKLKFSQMVMQQPQAPKAAPAGVRPAGAWQAGQVRPAGQQWGGAAGKGTFPQGGYRPAMAGGAWPRPAAYAPRSAPYGQAWH